MKSLIQYTICIIITSILLIGPQSLSSQSIGLHVDPAHNVLFGDSLQGPGSRLLWVSEKSALRAGELVDNGSAKGKNWDLDSIGNRSVSFGYNNLVKGDMGMAWGEANSVSSVYGTVWGSFNTSVKSSTVWGFRNNADGTDATVWGIDNAIDGQRITAWGRDNRASGLTSTVWGRGNDAKSIYETVLGRYADTTLTPNRFVWEDDDQLFAIGNGSSASNRNNALTILKNGNTEISAFTKLGSDAPGIKVKKVVGTTPATEGGVISFPHGIAEEEKIISATAVIRYNVFANDSVIIPPGGNTGLNETTYGFRIQGAFAIVQLSASDSSDIVNREVVITITYEE